MKIKHFLILTIVVIIAIIISYLSFKISPTRLNNPNDLSINKQILKVQVAPVSLRDYQTYIDTYGKIKSTSMISLKAKISGTITNLSDKFYAGSNINMSDLLVEINSQEVLHNSKVAKLNLDKVLLELEKYKKSEEQISDEIDILKDNPRFLKMFKEHDIDIDKETTSLESRSRAIDLETRYRTAKLEYEQSLISLKNAKILSPFNSKILSVYVNENQYISKGEKLADIYTTDSFEVRLSLKLFDQDYIDLPDFNPQNNQKNNTEVIIINTLTRGLNQEWKAKLIRTEAKLDDTNSLLHVIASIDSPFAQVNISKKPLIIGQYVKARIKGKKLLNRIMVPRGLVNKDHYVYIVNSNVIHKKDVTLGWRDSDFIEITYGLAVGDQLVVTSLGDVYSGTTVEIVE